LAAGSVVAASAMGPLAATLEALAIIMASLVASSSVSVPALKDPSTDLVVEAVGVEEFAREAVSKEEEECQVVELEVFTVAAEVVKRTEASAAVATEVSAAEVVKVSIMTGA